MNFEKVKRSIIFTDTVAGHNLEYLHHMYDACLSVNDRRFVFVVPKQFEEVKRQLKWTEAAHISFDYLSNEEVEAANKGGLLTRSWRLCRMLKRRIKKYDADRVFAMTLMAHLPFAPFVYGRDVRFSGIIYKIYLYEWKRASWFRRGLDVLKYGLMRIFGCFDHVFILNDQATARHLNSIYHTHKFHYLVDPYKALPQASARTDIRQGLNIRDDQRLLLHFGAMAERKGTMRIVESLAHLTEEQCRRYVFLFAGRVQSDIREQFYAGIEAHKHRVRIVVEDEFCSYERLASLCAASDLLLMPYLETAQSSGVIGYASQFEVPVLASKDGLIGKLVRRYHLGYTAYPYPMELSRAYRWCEDHPMVCSRQYHISHSATAFIRTLQPVL